MSKAGATKTIGGIALLVIAASGWLFVLGPRTAALTEVRENVDQARARNDALRQQIELLRARETRLSDVRRLGQALSRKFPPTADQPRLFDDVTTAAVEAGIPELRFTALTPETPVAGQSGQAGGVKLPDQSTASDIAHQTVTMSLEGTWEQLERLMDNLEQMPRAYLINSLTIGQAGNAQLYTATISGDMFMMPAPSSVTTRKAAAAQAGRASK